MFLNHDNFYNIIFDNNRRIKLGDHGVRKYDYEIGRFTSVDPLWEKYTGWTGYQYSLNNPVNARDGNGKFTIPKKGEITPIKNTLTGNYYQTNPYLVKTLQVADTYLKENPNLLKLISKYSNRSKDQVLKDFRFNSGPKVFSEEISYFGWHIEKGKLSVRFAEEYEAKNLDNSSTSGRNKIEKLMTITLMSIIHEYLHDCGINERKVEKFESEAYPNIDTRDKFETFDNVGETIPKINLKWD